MTLGQVAALAYAARRTGAEALGTPLPAWEAAGAAERGLWRSAAWYRLGHPAVTHDDLRDEWSRLAGERSDAAAVAPTPQALVGIAAVRDVIAAASAFHL